MLEQHPEYYRDLDARVLPASDERRPAPDLRLTIDVVNWYRFVNEEAFPADLRLLGLGVTGQEIPLAYYLEIFPWQVDLIDSSFPSGIEDIDPDIRTIQVGMFALLKAAVLPKKAYGLVTLFGTTRDLITTDDGLGVLFDLLAPHMFSGGWIILPDRRGDITSTAITASSPLVARVDSQPLFHGIQLS